MQKNFFIMPAPHIRSTDSTSSVMRDVLIALCPALIASVIIFGLRALVVSCVCVATSVVCEYFYRRMLKLESTCGDLSAVVTGLLLALNLPVHIPLWIAIIGSFVSVVIVKQLFGGIGKNFANPAIVGRIVLMLSFTGPMTNWTAPVMNGADAVSTATPLAVAAAAAADAVSAVSSASGADAVAAVSSATAEAAATVPATYTELFFGLVGGCLGETCKIALILGGIYLLCRKVISLYIPLSFMGTVAIIAAVSGNDPLFHLLSGGLMIGAIFMATDYVTSPVTNTGKVIFGIGCGAITMLIRLLGVYPEGVSFSILVMNILTPYIERLTSVKAFGGVKC